MLRMAIVLPKRRKQADIFAPSKAIQDAKAKIGPAYFDVSLLECSRNAVELTKLVNQWEEIDKEKMKMMKDITHDQEILLRTLKKYNKTNANKLTESASTPGFRFKSNGDIKTPSKSMLPVVHFDDELNDEADTNATPFNDSTINDKTKIDRQKHGYESVDYENEIIDLENVIRDIYTDLVKYEVSQSNTAIGPGKVKTFLRAHTNEYTAMPDPMKANEFAHPNDRFAFKPGSSGKREALHKHEIKTPSHRSCIGCQIRLGQRQDKIDFTKMKKSHSENLTQRRWNYVPQGKYVQSTTALHTTVSLSERKSSQNLVNKTSKTLNRTAKSMVHFDTTGTAPKEEILRKSVSLASPSVLQRPKSSSTLVNKSFGSRPGSRSDSRPKSCMSVNSSKVDFESDVSIDKSISVLGWKSGVDLDMSKLSLDRRIESSLSIRSARASSARLNAHFVDHESRLNLLKEYQAEEDKNCGRKIQEFLSKIETKK